MRTRRRNHQKEKYGQEKKRAAGTDPSEKAEHQRQADQQQADLDRIIYPADQSHINQSLEYPGERACRSPEIADRSPGGKRRTSRTPARQHQLVVTFIKEMPADQGSQ